MSHYEERLQRDLDRLRKRLRIMGSDVCVAVAACVEALFSGDRTLINRVVLQDAAINRDSRKLDRLCHAFIARHLPSGSLLRLVAALIRTNLQLERVGDYCVTIARSSLQLDEPPQRALHRELEFMTGEASQMLNQALQAFNEEKIDLARATIAMHGRLEHTLDGVYADLLDERDDRKTGEVVSLFVIFNMLKRISDQAKNISQQAIFATSGEIKPAKRYRILFVDEDNACLGQISEAIAREAYPDVGDYTSAGRQPAAKVDGRLVAFLAERGVDIAAAETRRLRTGTDDIAGIDVVISLQGPVRGYIPKIPFHTAFLEWQVGEPPAPHEADPAVITGRFEELYREIATHIHDLVEMLRGKGRR